MDRATESRLAALIMEDASRLRIEAEHHGVAAYLAKPKIRGRPDPQFLQATVRGIQQSNRIVEVNEMWRRRKVELGKDWQRDKRRRQWKSESPTEPSDRNGSSESEYHHKPSDPHDRDDYGLKDEELDQFLNARVKRGRGAVGSRMDETGPYPLSPTGDRGRADGSFKEDWEERVSGPVAGPSLPRNHSREWDQEKWKRKQKGSSVEREEEDETHVRRKNHKKGHKDKKEKDSKKKKRKTVEKASTRRR